MKYLIMFLTSLFLANCGGGGGGSSEPNTDVTTIPNVSGLYQCTAGCTGTCDYSLTLDVVQHDDEFILQSVNGTLIGTIDENGNFEAEDSEQTCTGKVTGKTSVGSCKLGTTQCQQVTYTKQ